MNDDKAQSLEKLDQLSTVQRKGLLVALALALIGAALWTALKPRK